MSKVFKDIQIGDTLYSDINAENYSITEIKVTGIEHITSEIHYYKEWVYAETEEIPVKCNKLKIKFDPIKYTSPWTGTVDHIVINLDDKYADSECQPSGHGSVFNWFTTRKAIANYYNECLEKVRESIERKASALDVEIDTYNVNREKVNILLKENRYV